MKLENNEKEGKEKEKEKVLVDNLSKDI